MKRITVCLSPKEREMAARALRLGLEIGWQLSKEERAVVESLERKLKRARVATWPPR